MRIVQVEAFPFDLSNRRATQELPRHQSAWPRAYVPCCIGPRQAFFYITPQHPRGGPTFDTEHPGAQLEAPNNVINCHGPNEPRHPKKGIWQINFSVKSRSMTHRSSCLSSRRVAIETAVWRSLTSVSRYSFESISVLMTPRMSPPLGLYRWRALRTGRHCTVSH